MRSLHTELSVSLGHVSRRHAVSRSDVASDTLPLFSLPSAGPQKTAPHSPSLCACAFQLSKQHVDTLEELLGWCILRRDYTNAAAIANVLWKQQVTRQTPRSHAQHTAALRTLRGSGPFDCRACHCARESDPCRQPRPNPQNEYYLGKPKERLLKDKFAGGQYQDAKESILRLLAASAELFSAALPTAGSPEAREQVGLRLPARTRLHRNPPCG